ncbi:hypothetical protein [Sulfuricurvum sp.]|uniref:hypothetical protein n=1 Tax=Sulfuricurvum sp. TaxID=2025608 RepID=UPI003567E2E5
MDTTKIKEAVSVCKTTISGKHIDILVDLAESVLSTSGKMPEKHVLVYNEINLSEEEQALRNAGFNEAIDYCTLAAAGRELSREELMKLLQGFFHLGPNAFVYGCHENEELAEAILKAQKERE